MSSDLPPDKKFKRESPKFQVVQEESSQPTEASQDEVLLTLSQIQRLYGLDDYWVYSPARKGRIRRYRILGKKWPVYSEPDIKEVAAMSKLGRTLKKLRALFAAA